jgi:hypothetical protein
MNNFIEKLEKFLVSRFLSIGLLLLFLLCGLFFFKLIQLSKSQKLLQHSYNIKVSLNNLMYNLKDAESAQRSYLLTKDDDYLINFKSKEFATDSVVQVLAKLTSDNAEQSKLVDSLIRKINIRINNLNERIADFQKLDADIIAIDNYKIKFRKSKALMGDIYAIINKFQDNENELYDERKEKFDREQSRIPYYSIALIIYTILVFILAYLKIRKDYRSLAKANTQLQNTQRASDFAEEISKTSHWEWNITTNTFTYSDNNFKMLGAQPNEFVPNLDNFMDLVHPDDKEHVYDQFMRILKEEKSIQFIGRIITKQGKQKYLEITNRVFTNSDGTKTAIGTNQDITIQYITNNNLEESYNTLLKLNNELSSFNYVASHDLQEPLRKIQLFISRIDTDADNNFSDKSKDYFSKIKSTSQRMQLLIQDLLMYSKISKSSVAFEEVSLDVSVNQALSDLSQAIEDKNAIINVAELPTVHAVQYQMQQLFYNLIGNSIKYTAADKQPIVSIDTEIVNANTLSFVKNKNQTKFYKIILADNGIGFDNQFAEKIFSVFQRLHDKSSYSGTGIGLAICKKIVENHKGYIFAVGKPNEGAIFTIYLPC